MRNIHFKQAEAKYFRANLGSARFATSPCRLRRRKSHSATAFASGAAATARPSAPKIKNRLSRKRIVPQAPQPLPHNVFEPRNPPSLPTTTVLPRDFLAMVRIRKIFIIVAGANRDR